MTENTSITVKSNEEKSNLWKKYFNSKEISSDYNYPFNFKNTNWYTTIVYLVSFVVLPIIYSLIKKYAFHIDSSDALLDNKLPSPWNGFEVIIMLLLPIIGMSVAFAVDWKAMVSKGGWAAYTHFIFGIISGFFIAVLVKFQLISKDSLSATSLALKFLIQVIIQFIGSIVVIFTNEALRKQIIATLKEAKKDLFIWILIFLGIISLLNLVFNKISNVVNNNVNSYYNFLASNDNISENQKNLKLLTKSPLGIFSLILGAIFLAPINEEISYRYGTFNIVRHKWLGFAASSIYFPAMHVMNNGDWNNIFGYLSMGIMAPLLFVITRGNTTYTIGLHMLINSIATIDLLVKMK